MSESEYKDALEGRLHEIWSPDTVVKVTRPGVTTAAPHAWLAVHHSHDFAVKHRSSFCLWAVEHRWFPYRNAEELMIGFWTFGFQYLYVPKLIGMYYIDSDSDHAGDDYD